MVRITIFMVATLFFSLATHANSLDKQWGVWIDTDKDCQNTLDEFLIQSSIDDVSLTSDGCEVKTGAWVNGYTGEIIPRLSKVRIDHLIPLEVLLDADAKSWDAKQRMQFANDKKNLIITDRTQLRKKNKEGLTFLPETNQCAYLQRWIQLVEKYNLSKSVQPPKRSLNACPTMTAAN